MPEYTQDVLTADQAQTLDGLFALRVRHSPEHEAYRVFDRESGGWMSYSWQEMAGEVARWQRALMAEGLQAGDRVAVLLRNCPQWVMFDQAALSLGLVVVPLYTDDRPDNTAYILDHADARLLLIQDAGRWNRLAQAVRDNSKLQRVLILEDGPGQQQMREDGRVRFVADWLPPHGVPYRERSGGSDDLASIVYTSGTTGRPKGVMLSHRNMLWVAQTALSVQPVYQEDVFLSFLPLSHTLERSHGYYMAMMGGAAVVFARSVAQLSDDLKTQQPTVLITVPRIFERVYGKLQDKLKQGSTFRRFMFNLAVSLGWRHFERRQGRGRWSPLLLIQPLLDRVAGQPVRAALGGRLRACACGGAPLSEEIARVFIGLGVPILQGYGLTESSPLISVNGLKDNLPASVGRPLPGLEVRIGDDDELLVRGPNVMSGYWKDPDATAQVIDAEGWLHTGDQVRIGEQGHLYITGRIKDVLVLSNGEKVPPADMEMAITLDPLFDQIMVVGEGRPYLTALAVLEPTQWSDMAHQLGLDPSDPGAIQDERVLQEALKRVKKALRDFPGYAKIRRLTLISEPWTVDNGLMTPTLKVKRNRVLERYANELALLYQIG